MYDYRRMNAEQRVAIVVERIERGAPWHKPSHPDLGSGWYFITGACYEHKHQFRLPNELTALQCRLFEAMAEANAECGGWVVMPNHYHLLVKIDGMKRGGISTDDGPDESGHYERVLAPLGRALGKVHGRSGLYANRRDRAPKRQVWFKYSDRKVRSERHYWASLHYIIMNPIKHLFVDQPMDWVWSCVHEFVEQHGIEWLESLRRDYPLTTFGDGWDD